MATYKKTSSKVKKTQEGVEDHSTTAEVFSTLDETASRSERWVLKNQKIILIALGAIVVLILGYLGYTKYILGPKEKEAANELAFPKAYFEEAMTNSVAADSLFTLALNGADGKFGFIDIADDYATQIVATAAGTVTFAGPTSGGYGNLVEIDHGNGFVTKYGHNSVVLVTEGMHVNQGQAVALMGSTGKSTGSHVHYEVDINGTAVDPMVFLPISND